MTIIQCDENLSLWLKFIELMKVKNSDESYQCDRNLSAWFKFITEMEMDLFHEKSLMW